MIRAVLFDFNGVIIDDEQVHFQLFQKVLSEEGISLEEKDYFSKYLGMDDFDCFHAAIQDQGKKLSEDKIKEMIQRKSVYYRKEMESELPLVLGVQDFIRQLAETHFLAIVSGALRQEIEGVLKKAGLTDCFNVVIAAEAVENGKPHPEGFQKALELLNRDYVAASERLLPEECLVIEDSIWGIKAAAQAKMKIVAVTTSYSKEELPGAIHYLKDYLAVDVKKFLEQLE